MRSLNDFIVYTGNIRQNILNYKCFFNGVKICAIVKADAYGHGIEGVVKGIMNTVDFFGVADEFEALKTRRVSSKPILVLNMINSDSFAEIIRQNISLSVSSLDYLKRLEKVAKRLNKQVRVHLKINTGMNRLGISNIKVFKKICEYINQSQNIVLEGIYTHYFDSTNREKTEKQYAKFCEFLSEIDTKNIIVHASASNAGFLDRKYVFDMVRLGNMMYGYLDLTAPFKLLPALKINATIVNIVRIKKGETVGYGSNFVAPQSMKVATVSLGYADGFLRANSNGGKVIIMHNYAKIVGNVCMDLFMCDVTHIDCKVGDKVTIIGQSGDKNIDANFMAKVTHTINYEILTNFKKDRMNYIVCSKLLPQSFDV